MVRLHVGDLPFAIVPDPAHLVGKYAEQTTIYSRIQESFIGGVSVSVINNVHSKTIDPNKVTWEDEKAYKER